MKQALFTLKVILGLMAFSYFFGSYLLVIPVTKKAVHTYIEHNLTENFGRSIVFDDIKGTIFSKITLSNVVIQNSDIYGQEPLAEVKISYYTLFYFSPLNSF